MATSPVGKVVWTGRVLSGLASLAFIASAVGKLVAGEAVVQGFAHLGLPETMIKPLALLELTCVVLYAIPKTSVLGAILLAGYMGGAICTHSRVGEPFFIQAALGVTVWLGLWLREPRLRALLPLRT
jgi:hypothetical protein